MADPAEGRSPDPSRPPGPATGSSSPSEERTPTRFNPRTAMLVLAVFVGVVLFISLSSRFSDEATDTSSPDQGPLPEETIARRPQQQSGPPGASRSDVTRFDRSQPASESRGESPPPSEDVSAALEAYRSAREGQPNPYGRSPTGDGPASQRSQAERDRSRQQRRQAFEQAITSTAAAPVTAPAFTDPPAAAPSFRRSRRASSGRLSSERPSPESAASPSASAAAPPSASPYGASPYGASPYDASPSPAPPILSNGAEPSDDERFLHNVRQRSRQNQQINAVRGPLPRFVLAKGTLIPIVLESAASSDLPGSIIARTTAPVYDRTTQHILIPAGAEIVTDYGQPSALGQKRLLVAATRMNLPDGRYVDFGDARATDPAGTAGLRDEVDRHLLSRFGAVGALAILGTAVTLTSDPYGFGGVGIAGGSADTTESGEVVIYPPGVPGYGPPGYGSLAGAAGRSFAQQVNRILGSLLERAVERGPTLRLRPGLRGRLLLGEDIDLGRPYYQDGSDLERISRETAELDSRPPLRSATDSN